MNVFNNITPYSKDMTWVINDKFTFFDRCIKVWLSEECGEALNVEDYDGVLNIKYRPQDPVLESITTVSGEMIFTGNEITFSKNDLNLKVGDYFYQLKLIDKTDPSVVGTLIKGRFRVEN